ncbi:hypothetical protein G6F42_018388 [Rhizopus arrhizus]|nr:hypothetical protein G6F42_018388 [Rhizopus arrhizus]
MIKTPALDESDDKPSSSEDELHDGDTEENDINEDLEPESSGSDGEMLLMLEDEYKEHSDPDRFGRLGLQKVPYEPSNFDVFVYDNLFYIPPHSYREYHLGLNHLLDQKKLKEDPRFQVVCDIVCDKLCNKECVWAQSASYIVQKEDTVYLFLVNDSDNTIILEPGELIANMDVIYMSEIEEFKAFKLGKLNEEMLSNELFSCEVQDDMDLDKYEDKIKDKIDISNVPSDIKKDFLSLISQFDHIFDWNNDKIGNINVGEHVIQLKPDAVPRRVKPYRLSRHETECLREELDKLLKLGIIERAGYSEWASPLIMLKKKDGTYRIVADF